MQNGGAGHAASAAAPARGSDSLAVSRRQLFALAAALAATALTAGAAIAGLTRQSSPAPAPVQTVSQVVAPTAPVQREPVEPGG